MARGVAVTALDLALDFIGRHAGPRAVGLSYTLIPPCPRTGVTDYSSDGRQAIEFVGMIQYSICIDACRKTLQSPAGNSPS